MQAGLRLTEPQRRRIVSARTQLLAAMHRIRAEREASVMQMGLALLQTPRVRLRSCLYLCASCCPVG